MVGSFAARKNLPLHIFDEELRSHRKADMDDVAILDYIVLALQTQ